MVLRNAFNKWTISIGGCIMIDYLTFIEELKELKKIHKDERPLLSDLDKKIFEEFKFYWWVIHSWEFIERR